MESLLWPWSRARWPQGFTESFVLARPRCPHSTGTPPAGPFPRRGRALPSLPRSRDRGQRKRHFPFAAFGAVLWATPIPAASPSSLLPPVPSQTPSLPCCQLFPWHRDPNLFPNEVPGPDLPPPSDAIPMLNPPGASQESRPAISRDLGSLSKQKHKTRIKHQGPSHVTLPVRSRSFGAGETGRFHQIGAAREEADACRHLISVTISDPAGLAPPGVIPGWFYIPSMGADAGHPAFTAAGRVILGRRARAAAGCFDPCNSIFQTGHSPF